MEQFGIFKILSRFSIIGFAKDEIGITINRSGNRIEIGWGQPVQKMEITRRTYKKETKTRRFKKIFQIPDGVVLDEIKAMYDDEDSILKILMPKSVDGILGVRIEEVKEEEVGDYEAGDQIPHSAAKLKTLETGRNTELVEDSHGNEEDDTVNGEVLGENDKLEAFSEIEFVAEKLLKEIQKLKGIQIKDIDGDSNDNSESGQLEKEPTRKNVNGEIKVPKVRSMEGIEVAEDSSQGTARHQKEKQLNAEAHKGDIGTRIIKKPDIKTQAQASIDLQPQVLDRKLSQQNRQTQAEPKKQVTYKTVSKLKEPETDKELEDIESPYLQSPANEHEEKGAGKKGNNLQDEIKEAREKRKSIQNETGEDSSQEAKQEKKQDSKQFQMRTPIIIAGSALLASLVIVVFNLVKSKRQEKNRRG